jgi:hypothetical protein
VSEFFLKYAGYFEYDPRKPATDEFSRLCETSRWNRVTRKAAREDFHRALVEEFDEIYGIYQDNIATWHGLFRVLGISPAPQSPEECKNVCHQNIPGRNEMLKKSSKGYEEDIREPDRSYQPFGNYNSLRA